MYFVFGERDHMARVRTADAHQDVVAAGEMGADVALTLATVLTADEDIDRFIRLQGKQAQPRERAGGPGGGAGKMVLDDPVGDPVQLPDAALRGVGLHLVVGDVAIAYGAPRGVAVARHVERHRHVHVKEFLCKPFSQEADLIGSPHRVDDD